MIDAEKNLCCPDELSGPGGRHSSCLGSVSIKTITRTENKVTVECPQVSGGSRSADDRINRALSSQVASFVSEASTLGGGKVHYDVHKSDAELISFTLVMTPNMGVEESVGMTFDRKTGELRPLSYYYTQDQLAGLAQNGLQYLYDVDPAKLQTLPDTYYVDKDGSLIGVYHAGAVLDKSEGEIEINLSAAGMDADGNVTEAPIDHSSAASEENASGQETAVSGTVKPAGSAAGAGESTGQGLARIRARLAAKEKAQAEAKAQADAKVKAKAEKAAKAKAEEQARLEAQAKADAQAAKAQPSQHKGAQQQPGHQIGRDCRKIYRLCQTGHEQACDQSDRQADKHLFHVCSPGAEQFRSLPHFLLIL